MLCFVLSKHLYIINAYLNLIYSRISYFYLCCWSQLAHLMRSRRGSAGSDGHKKTWLPSAGLSKEQTQVCSVVVVVVTSSGKQENSLKGFLSRMCPFCYSGAKDCINNGAAKMMCDSGVTAPSQPGDLCAFWTRASRLQGQKKLFRLSHWRTNPCIRNQIFLPDRLEELSPDVCSSQTSLPSGSIAFYKPSKGS